MPEKLIDLSHTIEDGLITYKGLPAPHICDFWSRADSRQFYDDGTEFQIAKIEMVANTGTYVDCPFHRYADGKDLSEMPLSAFADLEALVIRVPHTRSLEVDRKHFEHSDIRNKAVLVDTGWSAFWNTESYYSNHPFLTEDAALYLRDRGAVLVGIDSHNIDDISKRTRPVHSILLGANIPIVEHMCNLSSLPDRNFRFFAVPPKVKGMGTFPVRAYARLDT